ncbi:MAG: ABC transporter permease [Anaerolineae bacterium]|nr:ABC transporter permease [Anaerolineae bacterium]
MFDQDLLQNVLGGIFSAAFLASILRVTTPILLPSLGALISDRAGVINIGLEGTMLISAFTGVVFSAYAQDWWGAETGKTVGPWLGLVMGLLMGILTALLLAFFHLRLKANLILSGIAINFLGQAGTVAIMYELTGSRGDTQGFLRSLEMPFVQLPDRMNDIPVLSFFFKVLDNQSVMTWIALVMVILVWYFMYRTPTGIHLRAVGENPEAAASVGIRVQRIRYLALTISGCLAGLGGIHMSMGYLQFFQNNMTAGRGFIALATPSLGGGHPVGTGFASGIFGLFYALSIRIGTLQIPSMLTQMLPFVATVLALVIYALQGQLTTRVRQLRAAEGEGFDATFWQAIQRLSVLHMFLAVIALLGIIIAISMLAAPDGFRGSADYSEGDVRWRALAVGAVALALILINLPFMLQVERIGRKAYFSAGAAVLSLWLYLGLLFMLFLETTDLDNLSTPLGFVTGLVAGAAIWLALGGYYLVQKLRQDYRIV